MISSPTLRFFLLTLIFVYPGAAVLGADPYEKVLFVGNSITLHGPKADIDWSGNWGMAASAESKDYVHLVTKALSERSGRQPQVLVKNVADFERAYVGYDTAAKLKVAVDFKADLIILAIGENVPALKAPEDLAVLQKSVTDLLRTLAGDGHPTVLVRSCFWANAAKDDVLRRACAEVGGIYVDISQLSKDEANFGRAERPFKHAGVANHPGDKGMAAMAAALIKALPQ